MDQTERLSVVCKALGLSKYRIEGWIARGMLQMSQTVKPGQARLLSEDDAATIALAAALADVGMEVKHLPFLNLDRKIQTSPLLIGSNRGVGRRYLVVYARDRNLIAPTERGGKSKSKPVKGHSNPFAEVIFESNLGEFLEARPSIVIDLDATLNRVRKAFAQIAGEGE